MADLGAYLTILLGISALDGVAYMINCLDAKSEKEEEKMENSAFFVQRDHSKTKFTNGGSKVVH